MIPLVRRFAPFLKPYAIRTASLCAFVLLAPALSTDSIWMSGLLIDDVLTPQRLDLLPAYCGAFIGLTLLSAGFTFTYQYLATWLGEHFTLDVQQAVYGCRLQVSSERLGGQLARTGGKGVALALMHHDPLLSTARRPFVSFGHLWVVLALWVPLPMGGVRGLALPILFRLYVGAERRAAERLAEAIRTARSG